MRCLLCLATVLIVTKLQRVAFVTGVVTFNGNNTTPLNTSQTVVTQHVYQAYTALSLISLYRSDTAEPFTNFQSKIDVVEGTSQDTLTISISGSSFTSTNLTYQITLQYLRISNFSAYELQNFKATTSNLIANSANKIVYTSGGLINAKMLIRGFSSITILSGAAILPNNNSINYNITGFGSASATDYLSFDILIANTSALFLDVCTNSKMYKNDTVTGVWSPSSKSSGSIYVFGVQPKTSVSSYQTDLASNSVTCNGSCSAFVLEIDTACISTFVPINDLQQLRGW